MLKDGEVVKSWPLDKVVVEELLPFCSVAAFGDLKTQTTVVDPSVRSAYDLLAEPIMESEKGETQSDGKCNASNSIPRVVL